MTLTATVAAVSPGAGTPSGTVNFIDGSTSLGPRYALVERRRHIHDLDPDGRRRTRSPRVTWATTDFAASSSSPLSLIVAATATSTTTVTASTTTPVFGQTVTFTMTVAPISPATGTPTGTVELHEWDDVAGHGDAHERRGHL